MRVLGHCRCVPLTGAMLMLLFCPNVLAQRMVFAHYMLTNQDYQADDDPSQEAKIAAYEREIQQARALGIDGFVLNAGGWLKQPYYVRYAAQMFEAAARLGNGFKLMFSADFCCGNTTADAEDMLRRFGNDPRYAQIYFRYRGRFVLSTFGGDKVGTAAWKRLRQDLASGTNPSEASFPAVFKEAAGPPRNTPMKVFFVPAFFWGGELPDRATVGRGLRDWHDVVDGSFYWGIAGVPGSGGPLDSMHSSEAYAAATHTRHKLYMAPVAVQFWGANASRYYEYSGGSGMRAMWIDAIMRSKPEWIEIITWNDFIEGTYISPIDDPNRYPGANFLTSSGIPVGMGGYFHSHAGAGDLMSYYIRWYKSGMQPPIDHDAIYWFYRTQMAATAAGVPPVRNRYGPVADSIYVTANLKAPATLQIESGGQTSSVSLTAGSQDVSVPFAPGPPPRFSLLRHGSLVLAAIGHDSIDDLPTYNNFYYSTGECVGSVSNSTFTNNEHGTFHTASPH